MQMSKLWPIIMSLAFNVFADANPPKLDYQIADQLDELGINGESGPSNQDLLDATSEVFPTLTELGFDGQNPPSNQELIDADQSALLAQLNELGFDGQNPPTNQELIDADRPDLLAQLNELGFDGLKVPTDDQILGNLKYKSSLLQIKHIENIAFANGIFSLFIGAKEFQKTKDLNLIDQVSEQENVCVNYQYNALSHAVASDDRLGSLLNGKVIEISFKRLSATDDVSLLHSTIKSLNKRILIEFPIVDDVCSKDNIVSSKQIMTSLINEINGPFKFKRKFNYDYLNNENREQDDRSLDEALDDLDAELDNDDSLFEALGL